MLIGLIKPKECWLKRNLSQIKKEKKENQPISLRNQVFKEKEEKEDE